MPNYLLFRPEDLKAYMVRYFVAHRVPTVDAETAAEVLLSADLRGVDSHGIIRLNTYYGSRLRRGLVNPLSPVTTLTETLTTLALDGGDGLGQVVAKQAMLRCIEKANMAGMAAVTVRNSNHYGIAGYYAMMALEHDMIGVSFTNSQPLVAPTYGRTAVLGTNPIAVAVPTSQARPYVLDMATSIVPIGRITVYQKAGQEIPKGWGINQQGEVTTNPVEVLQGGALMPLGGIDLMRGYKGYGLAVLVDIFCGVLAGSGFLTGVKGAGSDQPTRVGHFFAAMRIDAFRPAEEFKQDMDELIRQLQQAPKAAGQERIYIHGEKEFELAERYQREGVPLLESVVEMMRKDGAEAGVPFDLTSLGNVEK